jgi:hypothetical protein
MHALTPSRSVRVPPLLLSTLAIMKEIKGRNERTKQLSKFTKMIIVDQQI